MLLGLACTSNSSPKANLPLSDTAKVLQAVFDEDFLRRNMPGYGAPGVGQKSVFGDTILLEINDSLDANIPEGFSNHYLKRISKDSICLLLKRLDNDTSGFPDFLRILSFQKIDSGYNIMLQATCVMPAYTKGKLDKTKPCIFGMLCGGGISIDAIKRQNEFYLVRKGGWSD